MNRETDSVVCHAVLGEIVSPDLLAAISRSDHCLAFLRQRVLLLLHFHLIKPRAQHPHTFFAILDLRLFVLATHYGVSWDVRNSDRRVSRVYRLTARPRRTECINAKVFSLD